MPNLQARAYTRRSMLRQSSPRVNAARSATGDDTADRTGPTLRLLNHHRVGAVSHVICPDPQAVTGPDSQQELDSQGRSRRHGWRVHRIGEETAPNAPQCS